jgi:hypothetical protein
MNDKFYSEKNIQKNKINNKYSYNNINNVNYNSILNRRVINLNNNIKYQTFSCIIPNLFCGNRDDLLENIMNTNIIIDVSLKENDLRKVSPYISNKDYFKLNYIVLQEILQIIDIIEQGLQKNKKIFVFCNSGYYYSSFIIACYFIKYAKLNKFNVINCLQSINPLYFSKPLSSSMDLVLDTLTTNYYK